MTITICPNCGRGFEADDVRWNLPFCSSACRLQAADLERVRAGADNPPVVDHLEGSREPVTGQPRRRPTMNQRLAEGFAMLQGEHHD